MQTGEDDPLQDLADAIVDGRPVRWDSVESSGDRQTESVIRELQVLASLAEVHRRSHSSDPDLETAPPLGAADPPETWGPFEIQAVLGRGSFGTVYRARDPRLDRDVALKLVPAPDAIGLERVVAEGRRLARVRHPNVITVFGADVSDGVAGIWMELLTGQTLHDELNDRGPLGAREAALVGVELCQALAAVHLAGLVHRDVKPQNVMRQEGGRIVLMDFGAGRDRSVPGAPAGTPLYMAPELLEAGSASVSTDLYSLGVLLFNLVTGEFPVSGSSLEDLQAAHRSGDRRRRLRDVRPDLPSAFIRAVEHATAANPVDRPTSAAALEEELEAVLRRGGPVVAGWRRAPRSRMTLVFTFLVALSLVAWNGSTIRRMFSPGPANIRSIAVLPFTNHTGSSEQEYLADGLTQLVIGNLAQLQSLRVISSTSSMAYKTAGKPVSIIAGELKIDGIIEGAINRSGDRIQVSVRLVRANEEHVWGHIYELPAADVFEVHSDISEMVADAIRLPLTDAERKNVTQGPGVNVQAQAAFLRGWHRLSDVRPESLKLALEDLNEAVRLDPASALAYAALSRCYLLLGAREVISQDEARARALESATHAIELDDRVVEAHTQLAEARFYHEWNWEAAQREYERALELSPSNSHAMARYSLFLSALGKTEEAIRWAQVAQGLDPLSVSRSAPGMALYYARRYDEAIAAFERLEDLPPYTLLPPDRVGLARAYSAVGRHTDAVRELEAAIRQGGKLTPWIAELARTHAAAGNDQEARRLLRELRDARDGLAVTPANLAFIYIELGDTAQAFEALDRATDQRSPVMLWANVDPRFDGVRIDKRFRDVLDLIGLR